MTPKFFDAHAHLNMQFEHDWREVGKRTLKSGISFVNIGADEKSSSLALEQIKYFDGACLPAEAYAKAGCTVGIHPTEGGDSDFEVIKELAKDDRVVAIGECGLEYYENQNAKIKDQNFSSKIKSAEEKEKQKELFKKHIELALEVGKPLMIHCRPASTKSFGEAKDAYEDLLEILRSYFAKASQDKQKLNFCLHFFTSDWGEAKKFLDLGGYLSFPGVITFSSSCDETIKNMPLDRIMAETDAPFATPKPSAEYLAKAGFATPVPHRGKRNEPAYVSFVAERIAELRSESREQVLTALVQNAQRFYNLPLF